MGVAAIPIMVEVNVDNGIGFHLVGLPDSAVKESQQRIETALNIYGYKIPGRKIVVNMAPADIRKEGSAYDLTLAIGILAASEQIAGASELEDYYIMGELSLDGSLQPVRGALPIALEARRHKKKGLILPIQNAREAAIKAEEEGGDSAHPERQGSRHRAGHRCYGGIQHQAGH